jgi:hypothetical protein
MLVVDLMHEVELNVWKAVLIHLLRILNCQDQALKHELDRRYESAGMSRSLTITHNSW